MNNGWIPLRECPPAAAESEKGKIPTLLMWHVYQGVMPCRADEWRKNRFFVYWRPVPDIGWISTAERVPGNTDKDRDNCVLARDIDGRIKVTGWHQFETNHTLTHWMRTPEPPDDFRELRAQSY